MRYVTLDIQQSSINLLESDGERVVRWSAVLLPDGLVKNGIILQPPEVAAHIKALLNQRGSPKGNIVVCLSGVRYLPRVFTVPNFKRSLKGDVIRHESERRMPVPLDELYLSWRRLDGGSSGERYFVVGVPRRSVKTLIETMAQAGIEKYTLDVKPIALARSANARESVILNLEQDNADVVLVVDGIPEIMRSLPVDRDPDALADTLNEIGVEVIRTVDYYNSTHLDRPMDPEAPVFFTGGLAENKSAITELNQLFGPRIAAVAPVMNCPQEFPVAGYAANMGLVLGRRKSKKFEVLASSPAMGVGIEAREYKTESHSGRKVLLVGAVLAALALLFPVYQVRTQAHSTTNALVQELALAERDLKNVVDANAPIEAMSLETALLHEERQSVLGNQSRFAESLSLVLGSLPNGMVPQSAFINNDSLFLDGIAIDIPQTIDLADQLERYYVFDKVYLETESSVSPNDRSNINIFRIKAEYPQNEAEDSDKQ